MGRSARQTRARRSRGRFLAKPSSARTASTRRRSRRPSSDRSYEVLRCATHDELLDDHDDEEERDPESRCDQVRGPEAARLGGVVLAEVDDLRAEPVRDRGGQLSDQRTDDARGRTHFQRGEDVRQRRREAELPEDPPVPRRVAPHQLERPPVGGVEPADRVHRHGEERQEGGDERDGAPVLQAVRQLRIRPDHNHWGDYEDRHRLRRDDPRQEPAPEEPKLGEDGAEGEADERADREAGGRLFRGEECSLGEHRDQPRADPARGGTAPERREDVAQVRHRRVVDDERPGPALVDPEPAVALPESPQSRKDDDEERGPPSCSSRGESASLMRCRRGHRRHGYLLPHLLFRFTIAAMLEPSRTVADLRELQELTGNADGAQRVAWTDTWQTAREWLRGKLDETGAVESVDAAGNQWFTLPGDSERALLIGGHIDSVPNGGWLDGALNLMAGAEVLRRIAGDGTPPVTVRLVNWADEEGARFGRSLFGSSAAAGSMADQDELRQRKDADGVTLPEAIGRFDVDLDNALEARSELENAATYLELHIEQGPVLESLDLPLGVVLGTFGVERHQVTFRGQAAHAGSTPMDKRRDALAGAAKLELEIREIAERIGEGAVCTMGGVVTKPGIVTSVVETAECLLDQRHLDAVQLAEMLSNAEAASERFAREENIEVEWQRIWNIEPILFDERLIELADESITEVAGSSHRLPSGPLHDAAEVACAGVPTVMVFVQSLRGLSHT